MTISRHLRQLAATSLVLLAAASAWAAPQYTIQMLYAGPPQDVGGMSHALGIAADGTVLVWSQSEGSRVHGNFRCKPTGQCTWFMTSGPLPPTAPGGLGMNSKGWVTGGAYKNGLEQAFLNDGQTTYDAGQMRGNCDSCGVFLNSTGYALSDRSVIVGEAEFEAGGPLRAFQRTRNRFQDLGTLGGQTSEARAINAQGVVAGSAALPGDTQSHAVVWRQGQMTDLGTLGGGSSWSFGINRAATVVGCSQQADEQPLIAFIRHEGQPMQALGRSVPGGSCALAINDRGVAVGYAARRASEGLWDRAMRYAKGKVQDLNRLIDPASGADWVLVHATAINASGQIAGNGLYKNQWRAFVLTPVQP